MNSVYGKGPVSFHDITCLGTPTGFGPNPQPMLTYYVKKEGGSDSNNGRSWKGALKTYQAGVTLATRASNRFKEVDLIIAPAEYDEEVVVSGDQQGIGTPGVDPWYGYRIGRLRIIHMGKAVVLKNSLSDAPTSHTLDIKRAKVELYGGTFRNYMESGDFAAVHWDRELLGGDVINGLMYGCKIEGRKYGEEAKAQGIGIDLDGAQYVWIERCVISGWDTAGILIASNSLGNPVENVVRDCYFRGNTVDVMLGGSQFTLIEDCKFMDDAITAYIAASDVASRIADNEDCAVVSCKFNTDTSLGGLALTGVEFMDNHARDF